MTILRLPMIAAAGIGLAMASLVAAPTLAQTTAPAQPGQQAAPSTFSEGEVRSFAQAAIAVEQVRAEYEPQMQAQPDPAQQEQVQQQAMAEMVQAVEAEGLSVEQYNAIFMAQQADPVLASQIESFINEAQ